MVNSVTFPSSLGGDNSTVDDSNSPTTGLGNNGHRTRFIPALSQTVVMAQTAVTGANNAATSAATASAAATAAESSLAETENYTEIVMSVANIDFANFEIVDGELLAVYIDSATSTPSIVDGEFVITYY